MESTGYRLAIDEAGLVVLTLGDGTTLLELQSRRAIDTAWTEITVERRRRRLYLYLNGERDRRSPRFREGVAANEAPLRLAAGFTGALDNLRLIRERLFLPTYTVVEVANTYNARNQLVQRVETPQNRTGWAWLGLLRAKTTTYEYDQNGNQLSANTTGGPRQASARDTPFPPLSPISPNHQNRTAWLRCSRKLQCSPTAWGMGLTRRRYAPRSRSSAR